MSARPRAPRLLVVDDQAFVRRLIRRIASRHGFEVLEAASVREALELLRTTAVDVVTCDLHFPEESGLDLLRALQREPDMPAPPVIVVSGVGEETPFDEAMALGAFRVVRKPFGSQELVSLLREALRGGHTAEAGAHGDRL